MCTLMCIIINSHVYWKSFFWSELLQSRAGVVIIKKEIMIITQIYTYYNNNRGNWWANVYNNYKGKWRAHITIMIIIIIVIM